MLITAFILAALVVILLTVMACMLNEQNKTIREQHSTIQGLKFPAYITTGERAAPIATNVAHVVKLLRGEWVEVGRMVRLGSKSAQHVLDTPGVALKLHTGEVQEGVQ